MAKALTVRTIEAVKPQAQRIEIPDGGTAGLFLIVQPSGAKSWALRYRSPGDGKPRKFTIGPYPAFGLADARDEAGEAVRSVKRGVDPGDARKEAKAKASDLSTTVGALLDEFLSRYAVKLKASTAAGMRRTIDKDLRPAWGNRSIHALTKRDVVKLLDDVVDRGAAVHANRVLALVRKFGNWCVDRSVLTVSPATGVKAPTEELSRDRVLSDDEVRWFWLATAQRSMFDAAWRLMLLTAQRRAEVAGMVDSEVFLGKDALWSIPAARTKNGRPQAVQLSALAVETIQSVARIPGSHLFFTTTGKTPISGWSNAKQTLDQRMLAVARSEAVDLGHDPEKVAVKPWRLHDLRRTAASGMASLGHPPHVVEAILNHKGGDVSGVAAIYNRYEYAPEKRMALAGWALHVAAVSSATSNVVSLTEASQAAGNRGGRHR